MFDFLYKLFGKKIDFEHEIIVSRKDILELRATLDNALDKHPGLPGDSLCIRIGPNTFLFHIIENNIN